MNLRFSSCIIFLVLVFAILLQNNAFAAAQHITFRHLIKAEEMLAHHLLSEEDDNFDEYLKKGFIHFPQDIRIAYYDLNDDGEEELFLYIRGAACGTAGCDLDIWKKNKGEWKNIGSEKSYDSGLVILDKTDDGYHEIWAAEHLIHWDGKEYK